MSLAETILHWNQSWCEMRFPGPAPRAPSRQMVVVTCMDSRIDVFDVVGLRNGEAHIIRNAGGVITDDVLRSIAFSQRALGTVDLVVVQHTDCGLSNFDDAGFRRELVESTGSTPSWDVPGFADVDTSVREQLKVLAGSPWLRHDGELAGFVYDVDTGRLRPVA